MRFYRQEYWSGVPLPSLLRERDTHKNTERQTHTDTHAEREMHTHLETHTHTLRKKTCTLRETKHTQRSTETQMLRETHTWKH